MKHEHQRREEGSCCCCRRDFLQTAGVATGALVLLSGELAGEEGEKTAAPKKGTATVRGAFIYPPSEVLRKAGYWSWPGSSFDPEGHQKQYMARINQMQQDLGMRILMDETPLDAPESVAKFIADVNPKGWPQTFREFVTANFPDFTIPETAKSGLVIAGTEEMLKEQSKVANPGGEER